MTIEIAYFIATGILLLLGTISILYTVNKVQKWRKPLYWIALPANTILLLLYTAHLFRTVGWREIIPATWFVPLLEIVIFIIAILFILVPYVDRIETLVFNDALTEAMAEHPSEEE